MHNLTHNDLSGGTDGAGGAARAGGDVNPALDCPLCPRLVAYRDENEAAYPNWFNAPVPSFGDEEAQLLVIGLAPGLKGANKTGRPFTGDYAGDLLYATLLEFGFAEGEYRADPNDSLRLKNCLITNAVRCVPPQNKPVGAEIKACRPFLLNQLEALPNLKAILALGRIAHDTLLTTFNLRKANYKFAHNAAHQISDTYTLFDSYHCSRYNTNTGRLTQDMFHDVFRKISAHLQR